MMTWMMNRNLLTQCTQHKHKMKNILNPPTFKQRLVLYQKALKNFDKDNCGFCYRLAVAMGEKYYRSWNPYFHMSTCFPEIYAYKPTDVSMSEYWWSEDEEEGLEIRRNILIEVIAEMKAEIIEKV